ncbi:hypothetical protein [Reinekea sp. G2M2-21]|uniref:hypothetical protein n=1 Tax=Reinekea sp. G2M2-21 TaxID=2788942 RepID=UPI0018AA68AC|nr:hypothetical protein [Reinekea sp. G2M2-21]
MTATSHATPNSASKALASWQTLIEACGQRPNEIKFDLEPGMSLWGMNRALNASLEIDPSGMLMMALIDQYRGKLLDRTLISVMEVISGSKRIELIRREYEALNDVLKGSGFIGVWESRKAFIADALTYYSPEVESQQAINQLAQISFDALNQVKQLERLVIQPGAVSDHPLKYNNLIYRFPSTSTVIAAAKDMPEGISLGAIIPKESAYSYFVLIVKSGQHVSVFSDAAKEDHPLQRTMRRNDRSQVDRISKSGFPYELLDITVRDGERSMKIQTNDRDLPSPLTDVPVIGLVGQILPESLLFLHLMFESIDSERHILNDYPLATSTDLVQIGTVSNSNCPTPAHHQPLQLSSYASKSVSRVAFNQTQPKIKRGTNYRQWLEDLLSDRVHAYTGNEYLRSSTHDVLTLDTPYPSTDEFTPFDRKRSTLRFATLPNDRLATHKQVAADAAWLARYNFAQTLEYIANLDYLENIDEMRTWIRDRAGQILKSESNPQMLKALVDPGQAWACYSAEDIQWLEQYAGANAGFAEMWGSADEKLTPYWHFKTKRDGHYHIPDFEKLTRHNSQNDDVPCFFTGEEARVFARISVNNPILIAALTGVSIDDLPVRLRHIAMVGYTGNNILDRLDPVESIKTKYDRTSFKICVPMSMKGLNEQRTKLGLEKLTIKKLKELINGN